MPVEKEDTERMLLLHGIWRHCSLLGRPSPRSVSINNPRYERSVLAQETISLKFTVLQSPDLCKIMGDLCSVMQGTNLAIASQLSRYPP